VACDHDHDPDRAAASPLEWHALGDARRLRAAGLFVAEGRAIVARLLDGTLVSPDAVVRVLATPPAVRALDLERRVGDRLDVRAPAEMEALTGFNFHRGVLALVRRPAPAPLGQVLAALDRTRPLVCAEHLVDVDNVGSVFRNARALGAGAVLLDETCADPLYRKAVRTSMGAVLDLPWTIAEASVIRDAVRDAGYRLVALTPAPDATPLATALSASRTPVAFVVGNEGSGLSEDTLRACDRRARIPMADGADSLNVATALAVALYAAAAR